MITGNIDRDRIMASRVHRPDSKVQKKTPAELKVSNFKEDVETVVLIIGKGLYSVVNYNGKLYYNKYSENP